MKQEMMKVVGEMVERGYYLFNETLEQFVDRMIGYGFTVKDAQEWRDNFYQLKGIRP